ncbi:hemocyte protein-glutamine gamma-glutamyltransferase-like [Liolophura sinensis]|uniref:hemocyte protein-glutamine gamma-glutamyltransferase-like n=1 Tax=Liolophura sinensis TaxID=3198878 RepID=UPI0031581290
MSRSRFGRDREPRIPRGPGSLPVTPRRPPTLPDPPDSVMMFNYGPTTRRRIDMDTRDMKFIDPEEKDKILPSARTARRRTIRPPEDEMRQILQVKGVDLHIAENTKAHHTDKYEQTEDRKTDDGKDESAELVVRRAQTFDLTLTFDRPFQADGDNIQLIFQIGTMPRPQWQTMVTVPVKQAGTGSSDGTAVSRAWSATIKSQEGNSLLVSVYIGSDCIIGEWDLAVYSVMHKSGERPKIFAYDHPDNIFILLNPWSRDDTVYLDNQELLNEYVLNDTGGIFVGNYKQFRPRPWFFGQFEDGILEITLHLLRRAFGYRISTAMADPVQISRALSKMVNANDDRGVVIGRWDGEYSDGKTPSSWTGSVSILDQYEKSGGAVKYGQCWVFSGVLTTVCRAIGLPARSVSNFKSAHDTDGNTTIDRHIKFDENGDVVFLNERDKDSIWNFHVWNDAWMTRPDLPEGHNGWQTIDSTPQELSEGSFQCGPSPVAASKSGKIHLPYDTPFVFAEVNGHVVYWEMKSDTEWKQVHVDRFEVGAYISTKVPNGKALTSLAWGANNPDREDITHLYKHPDGSPQEETTMAEVTKQLELGLKYEQPKKEVTVRLQDIVSVYAGEEIQLVAIIDNNSTKVRNVTVGLSATTTTYDGVGVKDIATMNFKKEPIQPGQSRRVELRIGSDKYLGHLISNGSITVRAQGRVVETSESFVAMDNFIVKPPELSVEVEGDVYVRKPFKLMISFTNPLKVPLTGCKLELSGPGLMGRTFTIEPRQVTVPAGGRFSESLSLISRKAGVKELVVTLDTNELPDIFGMKAVYVYF